MKEKKKINKMICSKGKEALLSATLFFSFPLQSPNHTGLLLWEVQGGKTSVKKQMLLEDAGSRGSTVILTRPALYIQGSVICSTSNLSRPRFVPACLQPVWWG